MIARRYLIAAGGLALAGCASTKRPPPMGHVVVVGGGFGGATAARYLKLWGGAAVDVTLVERNAVFTSCPMSNLVIGGIRDLSSLRHGYAGLVSQGVAHVTDSVVALDPVARTLTLSGGARLVWDRLVLAPGIGFLPDEVSGLRSALESGRAVHAWTGGAQIQALRHQLEALPEGGVVLISIPKAPYRCPPGPYERACLIASYLSRAKPRAKLLVLDANPEIQSKKALFERAFAQHHAGVLEYRPNAELIELLPDGTARFEFEDVRADVLNLIPAQRAGELARDFANVNRRWVGIDWLTMQSQVAQGVHVVGDALFSAPGMPKSGHLANQQAKLAAAAVLALQSGDAVNPAPVVMNTCYSFVSPTEAAHVVSVHQYDAVERTMKAVPGAAGVSSAPNSTEGELALAWARHIWADSLALAER